MNLVIPRPFNSVQIVAAGAALSFCLLQSGCGNSGEGTKAGTETAKVTIQNKGSDTMVNLAQAWAEEYRKVAPDVSVEVSGGGSGVGIAALTKGTIDIANASRNMKPEEIEQA
ncbi:MAG: substrate-binding domain-containing protein, partial [Limisphaerales bacterium]